MTDRITKHISPTREYGRKPYLVTKESVPAGEQADYRYMMDAVWKTFEEPEEEKEILEIVKGFAWVKSPPESVATSSRHLIAVRNTYLWTIRPHVSTPTPYGQTDYKLMKSIQDQSMRVLGYDPSLNFDVAELVTQEVSGTAVTYADTTFTLEPQTIDSIGMYISEVKKSNSITYAYINTYSWAKGTYLLVATSGGQSFTKKIAIGGLETTIIIVYRPNAPIVKPEYAYKLGTLIEGAQTPIPYDYSYALPFFETNRVGYAQTYTVASVANSYCIYSLINQVYRLDTSSVLCSGVENRSTFYTSEGVILSVTSGAVLAPGGLAGYDTRISYQTAGDIYNRYDTLNYYNYSCYYLFSGSPLISRESSYARVISYSYVWGTPTLISIYRNGEIQLGPVYWFDENSYVVTHYDGDDTADNIYASHYYFSGKFSGSAYNVSFSQAPYGYVFINFDTV